MRSFSVLPGAIFVAAVLLAAPGSLPALAQSAAVEGATRSQTEIRIDGDPADWAAYPVLVSDPSGDATGGGFDIAEVRAFTNDKYLYVLIEAHGPRRDYVQVDLGVFTATRRFLVSIQPEKGWAGHIGDITAGPFKDIGDVAGAAIAGGAAVEYMIPLSTFGDVSSGLQLGMRVMNGVCCGAQWREVDNIDLVPVPARNEVEPVFRLAYDPHGAPVIEQGFDLSEARGDEPRDIAISADGRFAYTLSRGTHMVYVIDLATDQVSAAIDLFSDKRSPFGPGPEALALTPDGTLLVVANQLDASVVLIDTGTRQVVSTLPAPEFPMDVAVSPDGKQAYVVGHGEDRVAIVDLEKRRLGESIKLPGTRVRPYAAAFTPDGSRAYVATESGALYRIDPKRRRVAARIDKPATGWSNGALVITPDGATAYLSSFQGNWVTRFDLATDRLIGTFKVSQPQGLALSPDGSRLIAGRFGSPGLPGEAARVVAVDPADGSIVGRIDLRSPAPHVSWTGDIQGLAFTPDGKKLYVAVVDADGIFVVDARSLAVTGFIPLTAFARVMPNRAVVSPDGATLYVGDKFPQPAAASIIDLATGRVETIQSDRPGGCARETRGLALAPDGARLYQATAGQCVLVVDTQTRRIEGSFVTGGSAPLSDFAMAPDGLRAYAVDEGGVLYVLDLAGRRTVATVKGIAARALRVKISPDGRHAYVTGRRGFSVVDLSTNTVVHAVEDMSAGAADQTFADYDLRQVGITPDSSRYLIGDFAGIHVFNAKTHKEERGINLFEWVPSMTLAADVVFSPDGKTGYLTMTDEKAVVSFDTRSWQRKAVISVGRAPYFGVYATALAIAPDGKTLYVIGEQSDNVIVIDATKSQVVNSIHLEK